MVDIATRVWNHKWKIDPIVRSLIDTDFYKLLMCQSIYRNNPDTNVTFSLINRSKNLRLAELIDEGELREQLDHIRSLSLTRGESTWLRGNTFYGKRQMFRVLGWSVTPARARLISAVSTRNCLESIAYSCGFMLPG